MKKLIPTLLCITGLAVGCAASPPVVLQADFQRKVITECDNDILCMKGDYSVTWDTWCNDRNPLEKNYGCNKYTRSAYPVTYKSKKYILHTGSSGYSIRQPDGGVIQTFKSGYVED